MVEIPFKEKHFISFPLSSASLFSIPFIFHTSSYQITLLLILFVSCLYTLISFYFFFHLLLKSYSHIFISYHTPLPLCVPSSIIILCVHPIHPSSSLHFTLSLLFFSIPSLFLPSFTINCFSHIANFLHLTFHHVYYWFMVFIYHISLPSFLLPLLSECLCVFSLMFTITETAHREK